MADIARPWLGTFSALSAGDQQVVAQLVVDGGALNATREQIAGRLARAYLLVLLREVGTDRIIAVGSLKSPDAGYRRRTFVEKARVAVDGFERASELGYVVVAADMRGKRLSGLLVEHVVIALEGPCYATTDDATMKKNLSRCGFAEVGQAWRGQRGMLSLWIFKVS